MLSHRRAGGGWKEEMKNNLMAFVFITIWIAMGIPLERTYREL